MEVSWTEIGKEDVKTYEAALIERYLAQHCSMPSFKPLSGGMRVLGNARVEHLIKDPAHLDSLDWSGWQGLRGMPKRALPMNPGAYRIRAVPPR